MNQDINNEAFILPMMTNNHQENNDSFSSEELSSINENLTEPNKKSNRKEIYGKGNEAKMIKEKIGDFEVYKSTAYKKVTQHFGRSVRLSEILGIINSIQIILQTKKNISLQRISRNEKRSFPLLMKYIERNGEFIYPFFQHMSLCNSSFQKIPLDI